MSITQYLCNEPLQNKGYSEKLYIHAIHLHALKALLPRYAGQVKCIYIDPPYNTGNEGWAYNILKDRSAGGGNVLTHAVLAREGIVSKQTPYALDV